MCSQGELQRRKCRLQKQVVHPPSPNIPPFSPPGPALLSLLPAKTRQKQKGCHWMNRKLDDLTGEAKKPWSAAIESS